MSNQVTGSSATSHFQSCNSYVHSQSNCKPGVKQSLRPNLWSNSIHYIIFSPQILLTAHTHMLYAERLILVSEWYQDSVANHIGSSHFSSLSSLSCLAQQILSALSYLEEMGITHRALAPAQVLVTPDVRFIVEWGSDVYIGMCLFFHACLHAHTCTQCTPCTHACVHSYTHT